MTNLKKFKLNFQDAKTLTVVTPVIVKPITQSQESVLQLSLFNKAFPGHALPVMCTGTCLSL